MAEKSSGVRELSVIGIGTSTPSIKSSSNLNLSASTVAVGATLSVGDTLQLVGVNTSLAGTAGTTGDIRMFHGAPFIHDGTAWREFYLKEGVPVTESADTEWDNVVLRLTFDDPNDGQSGYKDYSSLGLTVSPSVSNADVVASPRKYGDRALRIQDGYVGWAHTTSWQFDGDWTIEGWIYIDTLPTGTGSGSRTIISKSLGSNLRRWRFFVSTPIGGTLRFNWFNWDNPDHDSSDGTSLGDYTDSLFLRTWVHVALTRNATDGSIHLFVNGTESGATSSNQVIDNDILDVNTHYLWLGSDAYTGLHIDAVFDDWRISSVVRYSTTFTAPTEALPVTGTLSGPVDPPYFSAITEIADLSDVNGATPSNGQVLKWNGTQWAPATDLVGVGTTGVGIGLSDLSVTTNPVGTNALSYDDTTGTFTFTPTSLVGYATETYVDNAVAGIATTGYVDSAIVGFITSGASGAGLTALTGAAAGTYGDNGNSAQIVVDANGRITSITQVAITTDGAGVNVSGVSTFNDNVSFGSTILVDGAVNLAVNNATIAGTAGSTGDIKMIGGAPFFYDGSSWREFALATGTPVTVAEDTEWDNVIFRNTFDSSYTEVSQYTASSSGTSNASLVTSPVKYGAQALRLENGYVTYNHIDAYDFTGEWTIEGWFYIDALPAGSGSSGGCLISKSIGNSTRKWRLGITQPVAGTLRFYWHNYDHPDHDSTDGTSMGDYTASGLTQTWFHLALVREPLDGSIHFYIDGVESTSTASNQVIDNDIATNTNALLTLGKDLYQNLDFDGLIDDLRISTVARYASIGTAVTETFTPPTQAYATSGTLTVATDPPGDKYGEIGLGTSPTWTGTSGVTVTQQDQGEYRLTFTSSYTNADDYFVLTQPMDQGFAAYVGAARSTTHVDFTINRQSNNAGVDTGSLAVQVTNHP